MPTTRTAIRTSLFKILEKIGKERVFQGIAAFDDPSPEGISGCFMARCVGPKYAFARQWFLEPSHAGFVPLLATTLGLAETEVHWMLKLFHEHRGAMARGVYDWLLRD